MSEISSVNPCLKKPRVVAFEVTRRCPLNCLHCRASADADFKDDLTTGQCKKIIKAVADYNRCVLIFTGGEPFEREDIFDLIDYANYCGLAVSLATCGYNFDAKKAQLLKQAEVITLSFSLDSDNAKEHNDFRQSAGAFEKTLAAIDIAKKTGLKFQINTTVTKLNADKLPQLAELSEKLGAYCFNPFMLVPAGRAQGLSGIALTSTEYEKALKTVADLKAQSKIEVRFTCAPRFAPVFKNLYPRSKKKAFGCLAANDFAFISHTGDVQTCGFLKNSAGNILQVGDLGSIWGKSEFLNAIRRKAYSGKCGSCNYVSICGGCRARAYAQTGDFLASDPLCSYINSVSTLIAAHIEEDKISTVADAVNSLPNVSHNYLRKHYYNLWFTLKDSDFSRIVKTIDELSRKFKTDFFSFLATKRYKLDSSAVKRHSPPDVFNALFCCRAEGSVMQSAVEYLCDLPQVSHCFERKTLPHWPYNLYAMLHEQDSERLKEAIDVFVKKFDIEQSQILPTVKSLK
ncbi:MAG: radical SAM protein [Sedimentisphaerales bacterium]